MVPPKFGPIRPFLLLVRGARRGCFHPRSFAVLTGSLPRRAFSPRARLSAAAVWRLLLRGQHGYTLLYAICRGLSSRRVYFLYPYAVKGLLLGLTMSRPLSPPAVLPHAPSLPARRSGRPCPPNTAQRCHSEPVRRLAWESVPAAPAGAELQSLPLRGRDMPRQRCGIKPPRITPPITQQEAPSRVLPVPLFALFSALSFSPSRPCRPETAPPSRRTPPRPRQTSWVRCSARRW